MEKYFPAPERRYAIYPIRHDRISTPESRGQLIEFLDRCGFAGAVGNIRYTRNYPDDAAEWEQMENGFRELAARKLHSWIYDEKGYPSGGAGGVVPEKHPALKAIGLVAFEYERVIAGPIGCYRADTPGEHLYKALLLPLDPLAPVIDITADADVHGTLHFAVPEGKYKLLTLSIRRMFDATHCTGSYSEPRDYINLCDPTATRAFVRITHEHYAERLGDEFGRSILAFFTDEPSLMSWNIEPIPFPQLPWHRSFPKQFQKRFGYPIEEALAALFRRETPGALKARCDYWELVADAVAEGYFGTLRKWCRKHHLRSSGHMLEEERLQAGVPLYGSFYRSARQFDWPGIDQLASSPARLMDENNIPIARLLASLADLSGARESFSEYSDFTERQEGRKAPLAWIHASTNYHHAMGINNLTAYYSFDGQTPEELRDLNLHAARLGTWLRQGRRASRVAVLYPEATLWANFHPNGNRRNIDATPFMRRLDRLFAGVSWALLHEQVDFDYVDESFIRKARIGSGRLAAECGSYECLILPQCTVLSAATLMKLEAALPAGIRVIAVGALPKYNRETGEADLETILRRCRKNPGFTYLPWQRDFSFAACTALPQAVRITPAKNSAASKRALLSHLRELPDGAGLLFLANMAEQPFHGTLQLPGADGKVVAVDPHTGKSVPVREVKSALPGITAEIVLEPLGGLVFAVETLQPPPGR